MAPEQVPIRLHEGERIRWSRAAPAGGVWAALGVAIGMVFTFVYAGDAIVDQRGPLEWVAQGLGLGFDLRVPLWITAIGGSLGFLRWAAWPAIEYNLGGWVVTDRRIVQTFRFAPFLAREWPLSAFTIERVRDKKGRGRLQLSRPAPFWAPRWIELREDEDPDGLAQALREGGARDAAPG